MVALSQIQRYAGFCRLSRALITASLSSGPRK
jgi:hypothetical protein